MVSWAGSEQRRFDPGESADLRRRQKAEMVRQLLTRLEPLPTGDRVLVEAIYRDGRSAVEVAALVREPARLVRKRVRRIVRRALTERFAFVALHAAQWPTDRRRVAEACVLAGHSMRDAARSLGLTLHQVRRQWGAIETLFQSARQQAELAAKAASEIESKELRSALTPRVRRGGR